MLKLEKIKKALDLVRVNPEKAEPMLVDLYKQYSSDRQLGRMLGMCKIQLKKFKDAEPIFVNLVQKERRYDDYFIMAGIYTNLGKHDESISILYKLLNQKPDDIKVQNHIASKLWNIGKYEDSIKLLKNSSHSYKTCDDWDNLANFAINFLDLQTAELATKESLKINPDNPAAHLNLIDLYDFRGDWKSAIKEKEWRVKQFDDYKVYFNKYPADKLWAGQSLDNKTIIIYGEQGFGDVIQHYRFASYLENTKVIFNCPNKLKTLLYNQESNFEIIASNMSDPEPSPEHDYHILSDSLPYVMKVTSICGRPYLKSQKSDLKSNKFKVGFVWAGNSQYKMDKERSIPQDFFRFNNDKIQLYSLQVPSQDGDFYINLADKINDFSDTAQFLMGLDLFISCDTATAHLAGALGVSTWLCLPYSPDSRWGLGETSHWYDSIRIFRQESVGNWHSVFNNIKNALLTTIP
jgi:tetratricopeptide (TPR) repeat protein